ncbi:MAG TPA: 7-cyano-7-deazaguanine synthase QueC [Firmicutes bacterium]|nr:7-cyano-7-deazaguanine synthase QueC [Bacillota bacterium]
MRTKNGRILVLFSGGQDSTTVLFWAKKKFARVEAVSFDYGQRHKAELKSAVKIAFLAGVKHTVIKLKQFEAAAGSALLDKKKNLNKKDKVNRKLPASFVPGRNIVFLAAAASLAYTKRINHLAIGVSQADYSGYPDCRAGFIKSMQKTLNEGMEYPFKIHTPLINKDKKNTVLLAQKLGIMDILKHTHTCYEGGKKPCGNCPSCILREKGFRLAGIPDPLKTIF